MLIYVLDLCTHIVYNKSVDRNKDFVYLDTFVWDTAKNEQNKIKHAGLSFELASRIFNDPYLYCDYDYSHSDNEDRQKYIGQIMGRFIATVIATDRDGFKRIISARKATKTEVKLYEKNARNIQGD